MRLAKWQGLGNDYLIVEASALPGPLSERAIAALCDRHLGVGADGILVVEQPTGVVPEAVTRMRVFNPDGSEPEMCGNGIRMFARYLVASGAVAGPEFVVETLAGPVKPRLLEDGRVRVDMGRARFAYAGLEQTLEAGGRSYHYTFVDVGNPHCVILVDDPAEVAVSSLGPMIEHHPAFPSRANVEFVRVEEDGSARMRVWERGVGETQACGTGATAVGAALAGLGLAASPVLVHLLGGDLTIEVDDEGIGAPGPDGGEGIGEDRRPYSPRVFMTGPAEEVCSCDLSADLLYRLGWLPTVGHRPPATDHRPSATGDWSPAPDRRRPITGD